MSHSLEQLQIFTSLFKGREDVFAIRWERDGRSGYMPAYDLNWEEYTTHKAKGGALTFAIEITKVSFIKYGLPDKVRSSDLNKGL